ncbi:MAG: histidine kinase [Candidatus Latescibacterota bacterium]|nr:MAG: histidine kinase [Candidatus Latescibacterota bacterium]
MRKKVHNILLVSSIYDSFILAEDGRLYESLLNEYMGLNLSEAPGITRVSSGKEALSMLGGEKRFDLVITSLRIEGMQALDFAREAKAIVEDVPVILLTYDTRALNYLMTTYDVSDFDDVFIWQGDFRILLAIIKSVEDHMNVDHDSELVGVQSIILIEDNVRFYSSYLPIIYTELMRHTQSLISEGVNPAHKLLRRRARPKILLCNTYEEAWDYYERLHDYILGVISDIEFPKAGRKDRGAGIEFAKAVKSSHPDIPILLQSRDPQNKAVADKLGVSFLLKNSPTLLYDLSAFMKNNFSFGDFVFRLPDGTEVGRASDLRSLEEELHHIPDESLRYHGERNHFSNWLKARTEFLLAYKLRPQKVSDYDSIGDIRRYLINCLSELRVAQQQGSVVDFDPQTFDPSGSFARIGGGSLGGKGRGLAFMNSMIYTYLLTDRFDGVRISVPPTVVIGTDVFDQFMDENSLHRVALESHDDSEIETRFLDAEFPARATEMLRQLLSLMRYPLSVRSSSLLEDSQYQPFAGIYRSYMIPNNHRDIEARLEELVTAVKRVYASTFSHCAKSYMKATPYRLEEEKMGVVVQKLVGTRRGKRFYPDFSGVASSHNYYPIPPIKTDDGIASIALGLGNIVMEGGRTLKFSPRYPQRPIQFSSTAEMLENSQRVFYVLELPDPDSVYDHKKEFVLRNLDIIEAEPDGALVPLASTYSAENDQVYDGVSREGPRLVTFAPILKHGLFPLDEILQMIVKFGRRGMSAAVEIEFAARMSAPESEHGEFCVLQLRPMVISHEGDELDIEDTSEADVICHSSQVLGDGVLTDVRDLVYVDIDRFDRAASKDVAAEVGVFNQELASSGVPYVLIGVGRWGSSDPWLGIPVTWDQIYGARVMVETSFKDLKVTPSQGTHFFQNLISFRIGYFTVNSDLKHEFINWDWLGKQPSVKQGKFARHLRFDRPLTIKMNGRSNRGVILKPNDK